MTAASSVAISRCRSLKHFCKEPKQDHFERTIMKIKKKKSLFKLVLKPFPGEAELLQLTLVVPFVQRITQVLSFKNGQNAEINASDSSETMSAHPRAQNCSVAAVWLQPQDSPLPRGRIRSAASAACSSGAELLPPQDLQPLIVLTASTSPGGEAAAFHRFSEGEFALLAVAKVTFGCRYTPLIVSQGKKVTRLKRMGLI